MKIMQVTDMHIGREDEETHGVDVKGNLEKIFAEVLRIEPDKVVLTGDLCFKAPHEEIYEYISGRLQAHGIEALIIPGNHDCPRMMEDTLDVVRSEEGEVYFSKEWNDRTVIFLDTGAGEMSEVQYKWFAEELNNAIDPIIFMHHPPALCGVPYMDNNHSFKQNERFQSLVQGIGKGVEIFCGHYHVDKIVELPNMRIHITPSTFFQIRDDIEDFGVDHYRIGYRLLDLSPKQLKHEVIYLNELH